MILRCGKVGDEEKTGKSIAQVVGYTCMPPVDAASFLDACNKNVVPPKRNQCVIGDSKENFLFHCFDQATQGSKNLAFKDTDNFVCMDANDFLFVVDYCQQKRLNKK